MCNPSFADSLPSPTSSYSKNHYFSARLRKPSLRSMAGAGPTHGQGHGSSPSSDEVQPQHFLDSCFLCRTRLHVGDDIYMYRGDTPFCSEECRQEQIQIDEAEERDRKKKMLSKKNLAMSKINSGDDSAYKSHEIRVRAAADFNVYVAV